MCADLSEIDIHHVEERWRYIENDIINKFGLKPDPVYVDTNMMLTKHDMIRKAGIVQGLQDLGYLPERTGIEARSEPDTLEIDTALMHWRFDTQRLPAIYRTIFTEESPTDQNRAISAQQIDLNDPIAILLKQTSFEGELQLFKLPVPNEVPSLLSRILQYRMKTFNRYEDRVGQPFSDESLKTFQRLKILFGYSKNDSDVVFFNHLGNASKLSDSFCNRYKDRVFVYTDPSKSVQDRIAGGFQIKWINRMKRVMHKRSGKRVYKTIKDPKQIPIFNYNSKVERPDSLQLINNTDENTLGLELLQVRLWQHGFYTGAIDADWGDMSRTALNEFWGSCDTFEENEKQFRERVDGGFVLNLVYVFQTLLPTSEKSIKEMEQGYLQKVAEELFSEGLTDNNWSDLQGRAEEALNKEAESYKSRPVTTRRKGNLEKTYFKTSRRRRLNFSWFGIKAAIGGWFRKFGQAIGKIAAKLRDAILKGIRSVVSVFRYALSIVKRTVRVATAAVHRLYFWLSGKPFGTRAPNDNNFIISRWSMDFDTVNFCSNGCPLEIINLHMNRISFLNASFHFMLSVALVVLEILIRIITYNWLLAAYSIFKAVVKLVTWNTEEDPYLSYLTTAY